MKYLITGITGFLGPHLAKKLINNGHEVYGLIRGTRGSEYDLLDILDIETLSKIKFVYGDITDYRTINTLFCNYVFDGVFHLAAQSHPPTSFIDPIGTFNTNVMGSIYLITALSDNQPNCKFIFCSSVEVYGNEGVDKRLIKEDNTILPANPYGASKSAIDLYVCERMKNKQIKGVVIRPFCYTGPRRGARFSISSDAIQIAKMMHNKQEKVLKVGNLETVRSVTDVRDIANAFYLAMISEKSIGKVYNLCGGIPLKMKKYTEILIMKSKLTDIKLEIDEKLWRPIDILYQDGDSSLIKKDLGWIPKIKIEDTLNDLLEYWYNKLNTI